MFHPDRIETRLGVKLLHAADRLLARAYHQATILRHCPLPDAGPAILICNHTSSIDPVFLQSACQRRLITWMMAKEYLDVRGLKWFFRTVGIIPVARSGRDSGPLRMALRALDAGRILGIFPEGRIAPTRELLSFQTGVALMAIKTGAAVYPAYLDGSQRGLEMLDACLSRNQGLMTFGPAVQFDRSDASRENLEAATATMRTAVAGLRDDVLARFGQHPTTRI